MLFKKRFKKLRKRNNLTQKELAQHLNLAPSTISFYEVGERTPDYKTLIKIADYFDVSLDYLFGRIHIHNYETVNYLKQLPDSLIDELSSEPKVLNQLLENIYLAKNKQIKVEDLSKIINTIINAIP
ncbi:MULTISPECIES: helix-turn-helix domain-containing protein [unclassified Candidatus Frackibacter]|uniref:helix-turn-helix domain-containing protein n=1 Tax=unclassified Candidatus Frackibacter TaxID=2648818 RepID=UPI00079BAC17|nr:MULTISPECIES: helix-turn-helix transcriptional regulator [unclassified Candidatus Frackibacter]KXS42559.1 MAG: XRE family transcriptional regulator [Candidatus Frackibacter sp. T328-2]SDC68937.1 DNA-binding transcriptional regulator, XRE-family HTH domain [Candidatus Frackibacter sp. WG11]SEM82777.1 DNA-binding transcriptional regulator, XRE-family HTH domain [Candidatus Frackibacter sp. WG12]SFL92537.1 DNA-binding transcriptional regulator, XRE-family HTH domain [Candidatus Frackibacter sp.